MNNTDSKWFKLAQKEDCPIIRETASQIWEPTYRELLPPDQLDFMFNWMYSVESLENQMEEGHTFFLFYIGDVPMGYVSVVKEKDHENRYHLQKIYLNPSLQGKGMGRVLLDKAIEYVHEIAPEASEIALNVNRYNEKAVNFYRRNGFEVEFEGDFHIGHGYYMTDYIMVKQIGSNTDIKS